MEPIHNFVLDSYETKQQNVVDEGNIPLTLSSYLGKTVKAYICSLMSLVFLHKVSFMQFAVKILYILDHFQHNPLH